MCACINFLVLCLHIFIKYVWNRSVVSGQTPLELVKSVGLVGVEVHRLTHAWKTARIQQLANTVTRPHNEKLLQDGNNIAMEEKTKYTHIHTISSHIHAHIHDTRVQIVQIKVSARRREG
jgi:hypothetical protein